MVSWKAVRTARFHLFGILALAAAAWAVVQMHSRNEEIAAVREAQAGVGELGPRVEVVTATASPKERMIKLLGDVRSGASTSLYGKVSGYMKTMHVDKGDKRHRNTPLTAASSYKPGAWQLRHTLNS